MPLSITLTTPIDDLELAAINAMIAVLRGVPIPNDTPASSSASGTVSQPTTSATVPAVPAVTPTAGFESISVHNADIYHADGTVERAQIPPVPTVPAPPVVVPAPPASSSAPSASSVGVELDKEGMPWDARIHGEKFKDGAFNHTAKGVWKRKRNTPDELWESVRAENRQAMAAVAPPTPLEQLAARIPDTPAAEVPDPNVAFAAVPMVPPVPVATVVPEVPSVPVPPIAPVAAGGNDLGEFLVKLTGLQAAGKISVDQTQAMCQQIGLTSVRDLAIRPELIPALDALLPVG